MTGTLDGDAPENNTTELITGFPGGQHLHVAGAAHVGLGFQDPGSRAAIIRFFEGGRPASLRIDLAALDFERPENSQDRSSEASRHAAEASALSLFSGGR